MSGIFERWSRAYGDAEDRFGRGSLAYDAAVKRFWADERSRIVESKRAALDRAIHEFSKWGDPKDVYVWHSTTEFDR